MGIIAIKKKIKDEPPQLNDYQSIAVKQYRLNIIMTIATFGLFLLTAYYSNLTRMSVEAAVEAVEISKKQFEVQNQPFLDIIPEGGKINFLPDGQIAITYIVSNSGDFPTRIIRDRPVLIIRENGNESEDVLREVFEDEFQKCEEYEKNMIVSNTPTLLITKSTFKDTNIEYLIKDSKRIMIHGGELTYQDRLTNKRYKLKYAFKFLVVSWPDNIVGDGIINSTSEVLD